MTTEEYMTFYFGLSHMPTLAWRCNKHSGWANNGPRFNPSFLKATYRLIFWWGWPSIGTPLANRSFCFQWWTNEGPSDTIMLGQPIFTNSWPWLRAICEQSFVVVVPRKYLHNDVLSCLWRCKKVAFSQFLNLIENLCKQIDVIVIFVSIIQPSNT